ncbi:MAG: phosphotransferase family protein [Gammaproteobacteria bacterium]|jgi:aminoglycoside phosphotransferase (APT) family kinase protein|nr:phosphotransferase family protein [Gammaproteobacteria bacterium]MBT4494736.1 phosphotransferase family protein [Gammaproteobacteria bacterium]MBT7370380.1 phosphotransferase family protein [Gammaproteobacteria bacterium]
MTTTELSPDLEQLVTEKAGKIVSCNRSEAGASRITWLIETNRQQCVLREDTGDGPVAGTPLNLTREASVYRALAETNVKIPKLYGTADNAILMEMASGSPDLGGLSKDAIESVIDSYVDSLADLHLIEVDERFAALNPPTDPAQAATANVSLWAEILETRVRRPSPLATFATAWLLDHAPRDAERLVVCHGDVGPGNFMHDGQKLTAMLDWEFVHVGDPMDDLAWLAFRGHHFGGGIGDFYQQLDRWEARTGFTVSRKRIAYYRIVVMYVWLVSCLAALDNGARNLNRFTYLNLITLMNVIMPRAMMEYEGLAVPTVEVELAPVDNELSENVSALVDLIALTWPDSDPGRGMVDIMAQQVLGLVQLRPDILDQNREAVKKLTGETDFDYENILNNWIKTNSGQNQQVLNLLYEMGNRRITPDIAVSPVAAKPFLPLSE